jgi:hypothetical protein
MGCRRTGSTTRSKDSCTAKIPTPYPCWTHRACGWTSPLLDTCWR